MTPDEDFFLDRHPEHHNIIIGAGFSGNCFQHLRRELETIATKHVVKITKNFISTVYVETYAGEIFHE